METKTGLKEAVVISPLDVKLKLEKGRGKDLSKEKFPYHNWEEHIVPAFEDARKLGTLAGLPQREIELLQLAVLYHDIALPDGREGHEEASAKIAEQDLKSLGYPEEDVELVKEIVLGTKGKIEDSIFVYEPSDNLLVKLMRDLDLSNVGKVDFPKYSDSLRAEMGVEDKEKWRQFQIEFLSNYKFKTREAEELWGKQKKVNLQNLKSS